MIARYSRLLWALLTLVRLRRRLIARQELGVLWAILIDLTFKNR